MASLNKVQLIGHVGRDPEVRILDDGRKKKVRLTLATSYGSGENERTQWHNIVCWDQRADIAEKYIRKGSKVYVEGQLTYRTFEAQDGTQKEVTEVIAQSLLLLDPRQDGQRRGRTYSYQAEDLTPREDDLPNFG